jgi:hypothetical protein
VGRIGCPETSVCYYQTTLRVAGVPISIASVLAVIQEIFCRFGDRVGWGGGGGRQMGCLTNIPCDNVTGMLISP